MRIVIALHIHAFDFMQYVLPKLPHFTILSKSNDGTMLRVEMVS